MVDREVNPLEQRHRALSARFKAAWAFQQLLSGMQKLNTGGDYGNHAETFQSLYRRLKGSSESLHGATPGLDEKSSAEIKGLEREVAQLYDQLNRHEEAIGPSDLRKFFSHVRALDDRILIEVVRFYLEIQREREWGRDRLDKVDFLISRLAERIAGPELKSDQRRLDKVLLGLLSSCDEVEITGPELEGMIATLQDLLSEVRWVKTFDELNESQLVDVYRALKHDLGSKIFHARVLPLVVEVNNAFRLKIEELRSREEVRLIGDYQKLSRLQDRSVPPAAELQADLSILQEQVERFRERAKADDVRIDELVVLGSSLREIAARLQAEPLEPTSGASPEIPLMPWSGGGGSAKTGLLPDLDSLQPYWSDLLKALSGLSDELTVELATSESSLAVFRLAGREVVAFRRTVGSDPADVGLEQFILAAAALRHRICQEVEDWRRLQSASPGSMPEDLVNRCRRSTRMADAYFKHYSHLLDQAVVDGELEDARQFYWLRTRLVRESSGLSMLIPRKTTPPGRRHNPEAESLPEKSSVGATTSTDSEPFGELADH